MATLVSCPTCRLSGELPEDIGDELLGCPRCGTQFAPPRPAPPPEAADGMAVWVGGDAELAQTPPPGQNLPDDAVAPAGIPVPVEITAENAAAHVDWVRREVERFDRFVADQFAAIQQTREEVVRADARATAAIVVREQEVHRRAAALAARAAALDRREAELAEARTALDRRVAEVERLEASVRRRVAEIDELEDAIREELEDRERAIERQRRAVEEAAAELRSRAAALPAPPRPAGDAGETPAFPCG